MYIGNSHYHIESKKEHEIGTVEVYKNNVEKTGADGIQIGAAREHALVYDNIIREFGLKKSHGHKSGFQINSGTKAIIYNNKVFDGSGAGIFISGDGCLVYNNIVKNAGNGLYLTSRYTSPDTSYKAYNNTFVDIFGWAIYSTLSSTKAINNRIYNNIIHIDATRSEKYIVTHHNSINIDWSEKNNIKTNDINTLNFKDYNNNNFQLTEKSTIAIDKGDCNTISNVTFDALNNPRIIGNSCDIGAYEFDRSTLNTENISPKKNNNLLTIYPNPIKDKQLQYSIHSNFNSIYLIEIYTATGQLLYKKYKTHNKEKNTINLKNIVTLTSDTILFLKVTMNNIYQSKKIILSK